MNFKRALLLAGAAAAGFFAFKAIKEVQKDIERYDTLSTMSGDKTLFEEQMTKIKDLVGAGPRNGSV
ncbi:MAG: hypothetical protein M3126_05870 [Candidatus Eremiobacteraeota bacterium]|nr:hypothetical protein [Candidatus Eremiobacteraeota bacterium]